ncbi:methyl-accepting chemotaxis protein [Roseibium sp.]|uniref:methyl-accepting chemotaxis protein n=1 Tax=Roseibium sp. TaxID=1936156 RepID=UPI003B52D7FE
MSTSNSLVWKLVIPIPIIVLAGLAIAWWLIPSAVIENARQSATRNGVQAANQFKTIRGYYTSNIIRKAKASGALKPSINHKASDDTIPLPATMIHDLSKLLENNSTSIALYSAYPFPNRKSRKLDEFQKEAWDYLVKNPDSTFAREEVRNGATVMRVAIADTMSAKGCVGCHNAHPDTPKNDWKLGDVRGILEVDTDIGEALAEAQSVTMSIIVGLVVGGGLILAVVLFSARKMSLPISDITQSMKKMADGDLTADIPGSGRSDEIGQMASALTVFRDGLQQAKDLEAEKDAKHAQQETERRKMDEVISAFTGKVRDVVRSFVSSSQEQDETARSMSAMSEQSSQKAAFVSEASDDALNNVQTVAAATEEMSKTIDEITQQVANATEASEKAVAEVENSNSQMGVLADTANKIGEVIGMISGIAEQTNLLALNATIESARAGEAGRGFAVVASEVKELAGQTTRAAEEIVQQIEDIQLATKEASGSLENLSQVIRTVNEISSAISSVMAEQGDATREIASSVHSAADGTRKVNENIASVTDANQQVGEISGNLMASASILAGQAEQLNEEVEVFIQQVRQA